MIPCLLLSLLPAPAQGATATAPLLRPQPAPTVPAPLAYAPLMDGLGTPTLDGGDTELELADTNGDGHPDLLTIGDHGSPFIGTQQHGITTWFGDGAGTWAVFQNGNFGYGGIAVGDVNGDGLPDVGYGMHHDYSSDDFGDQLLEVALGDGTGLAWTPWDDGLATNGETWGMFATDFADVDEDGRLDVGSNSFGCCAGVHVYRNEGDGTWTQTFGFLGGNADPVFVFGEVDGDGHVDLVAANSLGNVWLGDGAGGFVNVDANLPGTAQSRQGFDLGDVDGDGRDELAFALGGALHVFAYAPGAEGGGSWTSLGAGLPRSGLPSTYVQLDDMDADGALDLVSVGGGQGRVWRGNGAGGWQLAAGWSPGSGTIVTLRTGDVDHNGRPDVAWVQDEPCGFLCSRNRLYLFAEASVPVGLEATLARPRGGETWVAGSVRIVEWRAAVPPGSSGWPGVVEVALSTGAGGPWSVLAAGEPNDGSFQLVVPPSAVSNDCRVRVRVRAGGSTAEAVSGPFRIVP